MNGFMAGVEHLSNELAMVELRCLEKQRMTEDDGYLK